MQPKDTFHRIPAAKREKLLREAARLFAQRGLAQTDMAELAARAGVAKGSLYNYFASKEDFYEYVCRDGLERSRQAVYDGLDHQWPVRRQVEHIFLAGMAFGQAHPEYVALYLNVASAGMDEFARRLSRDVERHTARYLKGMLEQGQARGEVRADLDLDLAAYLINSLYIMFLAPLASAHYRIRMREYLDIKGRLTGKALELHLGRTIALIMSSLEPGKTRP